MTIYHYRFETDVEFRYPVTHHHFMLRCMPKECMCQHIIDCHYEIKDATWLSEGTDVFGNHVIYGSAIPAHTRFSILSEGHVSRRYYAMYDAPRPCFESQSPLTAVSPEMLDMLHETLGRSSHVSFQQLLDLCHAVHAHMTYQGGVTNSHTTAAEAFTLKKGVCQDYSHIMIALCRAAGIPARYVSGFIPGEGASHAWVEVYDKSRWTGIDPTNDCMADKDYIIIAHGRDADDCPMNRGIYTGLTDELMTVKVEVASLSPTEGE